MRILSSKINLSDNLLLFEGNFFSGTVFFQKENLKIEAFEVSNGVISGQYVPDYFMNLDHQEKIDATAAWDLTEDYIEDIFLYNEKPYSGVAFGFSDGICVREVAYKNGFWLVDAIWSKFQKISLALNYFDSFQKIEWHENDKIKTVEINFTSDCAASFGLSNDGKYYHINIKGNFFDELEQKKKDIYYIPAYNVEDICKFDLAERFFLSGGGINNIIFKKMIESKIFRNTQEMHLRNLDIDPTLFKNLFLNFNIKKIRMEIENLNCLEYLNSLRRNIPNLNVELFHIQSDGRTIEVK